MAQFSKPQKIESFKEAKLWSLDWAQETFPDCEFYFYICEKVDGGYLLHGIEYDTNDAFNLRRDLVEKLGTTKLFIRAKRKPLAIHFNADPDSDAEYEACKDFYNEGRSIHEVPMSLRSAFKDYCQSQGRSAR